jgi:UDP-N-acetylmuramoyl-tripeptide--D-alanyl-D-alanine ligase
MTWSYTLNELADFIGAGAPRANPELRGVSTDTRTLQPGQVFFALSGENFDGSRFVPEAFAKGAAAAVTKALPDPPVPGPCLLMDDPLEALQSFAACHRDRYLIPLIAITGSCGKTTTKDLTAALLGSRHRVVKTPGNLNNDIGCPLSLLGIDNETAIAVIEMGANHTGEIADLCKWARPTEAAITLVAPAHLEGFGSVENVAKAKGEIVQALPSDGTYYVNVDDPWCAQIAERFPGNKVLFGSHGDVVLTECDLNPDGDSRLCIDPVGELQLPLFSRAHAANVLLAIAVGLRHGISEFEEPLRTAAISASRGNVITVGPLVVLDDTYNANPASMRAALDALAARAPDGGRLAVLGDMLELGDQASDLHRALGRHAAQAGVTHLFARGDYAADVVNGAREGGVPHAEAIQEHAAIADALHATASRGDVALVKGSRGMRMERVIQALQELYAAEESSCSTT